MLTSAPLPTPPPPAELPADLGHRRPAAARPAPGAAPLAAPAERLCGARCASGHSGGGRVRAAPRLGVALAPRPPHAAGRGGPVAAAPPARAAAAAAAAVVGVARGRPAGGQPAVSGCPVGRCRAFDASRLRAACTLLLPLRLFPLLSSAFAPNLIPNPSRATLPLSGSPRPPQPGQRFCTCTDTYTPLIPLISPALTCHCVPSNQPLFYTLSPASFVHPALAASSPPAPLTMPPRQPPASAPPNILAPCLVLRLV